MLYKFLLKNLLKDWKNLKVNEISNFNYISLYYFKYIYIYKIQPQKMDPNGEECGKI